MKFASKLTPSRKKRKPWLQGAPIVGTAAVIAVIEESEAPPEGEVCLIVLSPFMGCLSLWGSGRGGIESREVREVQTTPQDDWQSVKAAPNKSSSKKQASGTTTWTGSSHRREAAKPAAQSSEPPRSNRFNALVSDADPPSTSAHREAAPPPPVRLPSPPVVTPVIAEPALDPKLLKACQDILEEYFENRDLAEVRACLEESQFPKTILSGFSKVVIEFVIQSRCEVSELSKVAVLVTKLASSENGAANIIAPFIVAELRALEDNLSDIPHCLRRMAAFMALVLVPLLVLETHPRTSAAPPDTRRGLKQPSSALHCFRQRSNS
eukprot:m.88637 g.88637  ORF g.88637 m.88637 type:complete len:323 (-) comp51020_c0_seq2:887-1855(-)